MLLDFGVLVREESWGDIERNPQKHSPTTSTPDHTAGRLMWADMETKGHKLTEEKHRETKKPAAMRLGC